MLDFSKIHDDEHVLSNGMNMFFIYRRLAYCMKHILFIGAGSMAEAMIHGFTKQQVFAPSSITVTNKQNKTRLQYLQTTYGVTPTCDIATAIAQTELVILAMKPKDVASSLQMIQPYLQPHTPILSVVAGYAIESITSILSERPIARIMPNTSAQIAMSTTGVAFNACSDETFKQSIHTMLRAIGSVVEVAEDQLHVVTALSGSGPAYFYYVVEAMQAAGLAYGLPQETVEKLVVETMAGAAEMLKQTNETPDILRQKITSPGGTTAAAIQALEQHHVKDAFTACVHDAEQKSRHLAKSAVNV